jgi:hypothetical protein
MRSTVLARLLADTAAARPDSLHAGVKAVTTVENGIKTTRYYGECFVKAMTMPGRRVAGFYTPNGYITTNGTMMR